MLDPSTPIPDRWTRNVGPTYRELRPGMEVRLSPVAGSPVYEVVSISFCSASIKAPRLPLLQIAPCSEVEYRAAQTQRRHHDPITAPARGGETPTAAVSVMSGKGARKAICIMPQRERRAICIMPMPRD